MKKYKFTGTKTFWVHYEMNVKAKNEEDARWKAHDCRYNDKDQWKKVETNVDDKLNDIELINNKDEVVFKPLIRNL